MARSKQTAPSSKATKSVTRELLKASALGKPRKTIKIDATKHVKEAPKTGEAQEKKKRKFSHGVLFVRRTRKQQSSVEPILNYAASIRIVKWAVDNTDGDGLTNQLRFKPSAIRALHQAAEHVTNQILNDAYHTTVRNNMRELQPRQLEDAIEVWSKYNDANLKTQVRDLVMAYNEDN